MANEDYNDLKVDVIVIYDAALAAKELQKELSSLKNHFEALKGAILHAVTPLLTAFLPVVDQAIVMATRLANEVGKLIAALFGESDATENLTKKTNKATASQKSLATTAQKVKRALAGFDQITRLGEAGGKSGGGAASGVTEVQDAVKGLLSPQLYALVNRLLPMFAALESIDLTPAAEAFNRFREALVPINWELFSALEWAWYNLFVPLARWSIEEALPAFLDVLTAALRVLNQVIVALKPAATWLWENFLKPIAQWTGSKMIETLNHLRLKLGDISLWIEDNQELVGNLIIAIGLMAAAWTLLNSETKNWSGQLGILSQPIINVSQVVASLSGLVFGLGNALGSMNNSWGGIYVNAKEKLFGPLQTGFRSMANGIIGIINAMISGVAQGINSVVNAVNKIKLSIPSWVPGYGGKSIGFHLKTVTAPRIPYLAQGAVLPANRPFLAMVGDQRHGTNIEAPLTTIEEAVAGVMQAQNEGLMAVLSASVGVQQEILEAVLGIHIGDEVIGKAVSRYQRKMSVVKGV